ncbi:MAG TPA: pyrroline-5-carboxylate reductase [Phycisphaerae bacterium]|nr:pyrroline-5-carboxylate reductase [Phycisphaerae bacterium]
MHTQYEIAVIGAGNAAEGIVHGLLQRMILLDDRIVATDPNADRRKAFADRFRIAVSDDNRLAVQESYIVLLAVKPQQYRDVCAGFADLIREDHVIVSIMAGVSTASLEAQFPQRQARVVRVMPNLAMHVGEGVAGIFPGRHATEADLLRTQRIFEAGGRTVVVDDEGLMDAVTAVSGTGPAYFYYFCEAIIAAGEKAGLSHQQATLLATQTCLGAARMMIESNDPPDVLCRKVMSPGGTTQAAIESMLANHVKDNVEAAVLAAWKRSQELGR